MIRTARLAAVALSSVLGLSMLSAVPASAQTDFYTPPATLPSANGALVKAEPMKLGITFPQLGKQTSLPGTATRIMYKTTDEGGQPAAVSGAYIEPSKPWKGLGERPLVSLSVGTQGVGDACAPSKTLASFLHTENGKFMIGYEVPAIYGFLNQGVAVVVTDYIGLGTTDRVHTYMNRVDQGHAVLDAARAALALPDTSISTASSIGLSGYSQGGGASAAAAELAPSYAPELNLKAAYVGGPPADLFEVMKSIDGTLLTGALPWAINAMHAYRPELTPYLTSLLNAKGQAALKASEDQCLVDAIATSGFKKSKEWTNSGKPAAVEVADVPALMRAVEDQRIGRLKPTHQRDHGPHVAGLLGGEFACRLRVLRRLMAACQQGHGHSHDGNPDFFFPYRHISSLSIEGVARGCRSGVPAWSCLSTALIWLSVKRDFFIGTSSGKRTRKFHLWG